LRKISTDSKRKSKKLKMTTDADQPRVAPKTGTNRKREKGIKTYAEGGETGLVHAEQPLRGADCSMGGGEGPNVFGGEVGK